MPEHLHCVFPHGEQREHYTLAGEISLAQKRQALTTEPPMGQASRDPETKLCVRQHYSPKKEERKGELVHYVLCINTAFPAKDHPEGVFSSKEV